MKVKDEEQITRNVSSSSSDRKIEGESQLVQKTFDKLVDAFVSDYTLKKIVAEKCGWRTAYEISRDVGAPLQAYYAKNGDVGPALKETIRKGLVEMRYFPGERGRGGEVRRFRIAYEKEPIRSNVDLKIGVDRKSRAMTSAMSLEESAKTTLKLNPKRVAVLPFVSMSSDPNDEYFADGLTEELITRISLVRGLEIIARTSVMGFKKKDLKVSEIGRELKVGTLLEGSVRKAGNKIRVSAQLINVNTESHLWAENYDRDLEDIFKVQSSIAEHVAGALKLRLLSEDKERVSTGNIEAYTMYLRAIELYNEDIETSCREAIALFNGAILKDLTFARAYAGLANAWIGLTGPAEFATCVERAETAARKALELGPELAESHAAMARVDDAMDWFDESRIEMEKAIRINPNLADANRLLGWNYAIFGRFDEAISYLRKACALNPLDAVPASYLIMILRVAGKVEEALNAAEGLKDLHRRNPLVYVRSAHCYLQKKDYAKAFDEIDIGLRFNPDHHWLRTTRGLAYAMSGKKEQAMDELRYLMTDETESNRVHAQVSIQTALGNLDEAFEALMRQAEIHSWWGLIKFDPFCEELRKDPRFSEFCTKVGLPTS
jgi:adenylate cyclase